MSRFVFKMPDLGEGAVAAEILDWRIAPGDMVAEDQVMVEVMTDKAAIEVPAPVSGRVLSIKGVPGESIAVGSEFIVFETDTTSSAPPQQQPRARNDPTPTAAPPVKRSGRILASPATRRRAKEAHVDLAELSGTGPHGRITRADLESRLSSRDVPAKPNFAPATSAPPGARGGTEEIKIIGVRRVIAERLSEAKRTIPHFAYIEEIDVTALEALRCHLNEKQTTDAASLTYLPFLILALARTLINFPQCNARYDAERGVLIRERSLHIGIATQTPDGLKVPVIRDAEAKSLWTLASEIREVSAAARNGTASRETLTGSTLTITSLGKLGGLASTPIINAPEVAIIGVNKAVERPVVVDGAITIRRMMNLSSSFDHRFVDGYDAAAMIQALKELLEHPATIFIDRD